MKCARHGDTETSLACGRCETPVCTRCVVQTDVGIRCRTCAPIRHGIPGFGSSRFRNAAIVVGVLFGAVLLVGGVSQLGGSSTTGLPDYDQFYDEVLEQYQPEISANQFIDPWVPPSPDARPRAGRRLVAVEVTLEYPAGREASHFVSSTQFKLVDAEGFVHGAGPIAAEPALPEGLELAPGQKTRGWITFDLEENTDVTALAYGVKEVPLPEPES
jgi:hypothetical protein